MTPMHFADAGQKVRQLNNSLVHLEYLLPEHGGDFYGHYTVIAICRVQARHGLEITGEAGRDTLKRISGDLFEKG